MKNQNANLALSIIVLLAALAAAMVAGCVWGAADIGAGDMMRVIASKLPWIGRSVGELPAGVEAIIWQLRLPRVILAAVVGGSLAGAGEPLPPIDTISGSELKRTMKRMLAAITRRKKNGSRTIFLPASQGTFSLNGSIPLICMDTIIPRLGRQVY